MLIAIQEGRGLIHTHKWLEVTNGLEVTARAMFFVEMSVLWLSISRNLSHYPCYFGMYIFEFVIYRTRIWSVYRETIGLLGMVTEQVSRLVSLIPI